LYKNWKLGNFKKGLTIFEALYLKEKEKKGPIRGKRLFQAIKVAA